MKSNNSLSYKKGSGFKEEVDTKKSPIFQPCADDYEFVDEMLNEQIDAISEMRRILRYIQKNHRLVFWEAYADGSQSDNHKEDRRQP